MKKSAFLKLLFVTIVFMTGCTSKPKFSIEKVKKPDLKEIVEAYIDIPMGKDADMAENVIADLEQEMLQERYIGIRDATLEKADYKGVDLYYINGSDYLCRFPKEDNRDAAIEGMANRVLAWQRANQNVSFYVYYVNRIENCDWFSQMGIQANDYYKHFQEQFEEQSQIRFGEFVIEDLQDYMNNGYKTDFHINYRGSDRMYHDIYDMISRDFDIGDIHSPTKENDYGNLLMIGQLFEDIDVSDLQIPVNEMDVFKTYSYDLPDYDSYIGDKQMRIGLEEEYQEGIINRDVGFDHQFAYYGGQADIVRFDFKNDDKENLLIISDSQGRPSRKLLASHFNKTVFIDDIQCRAMDVSQIISENEIDIVVFIGQQSMYELWE